MQDRYNQVEVECVHLEDEVEDAIFHGDFNKLREVQERLLQAREELYTLKDALRSQSILKCLVKDELAKA